MVWPSAPVSSDLMLAERLVLALLLSGLIGLERELHRTSVGLRTHALVGTLAALFMTLAEVMIERFGARSSVIKLDPLAVLGATVSGISFLGAGAIIASSTTERRQSLTSAASILGSAGVGLCCGLERYLLGAVLTALLLLVLHGFRVVEVRLLRTHDPEAPDRHPDPPEC
ncbi:putative Mg2+ transporter-C (MgtC) family protein [Deinococcus reticulitermitis]|uniref:Putative Mg2+ transporter-C (MgtC) family protein n=1 Tax=Deinococcus reticulitermitis TaxID=856736 RepID=A0A1H7BPS1_9DEIO|nr:MgtC/SapB family protein [Deinococcus reticulitermitis]SEJ78307.1 putative Mg2+ transporter-C (MgtC) family protein [Deinococcus reticulitermitis]